MYSKTNQYYYYIQYIIIYSRSVFANYVGTYAVLYCIGKYWACCNAWLCIYVYMYMYIQINKEMMLYRFVYKHLIYLCRNPIRHYISDFGIHMYVKKLMSYSMNYVCTVSHVKYCVFLFLIVVLPVTSKNLKLLRKNACHQKQWTTN